MKQPINHCIGLLDNVGLNKETRARLRPHMSNWLTVHAHIKTLEDKAGMCPGPFITPQACVYEMKQMLMMELVDHALQPRWTIIDRLHTRISRWERVVTDGEIAAWLKGQKKALSRGI